MMQDPHLHSTIRGDEVPPPVDEYSLRSFYDRLTHPAALVGLISANFALFNPDLRERIVQASGGQTAAILHLLLVLLALVVGIRLIHSIYLAKRDYRQLESGFGDVILFLMVLVFTSGVLLYLLKDKPLVVIWIYAVGALAATANFWHMYWVRIPRIRSTCDYPIERRIQAVNTAIFAVLTIALIWAAWSLSRPAPDVARLYWLVGACIVLLLVNILHSEQLTMHPKFLMHNRADVLSRMLEVIHAHCGATLGDTVDAELKTCLEKVTFSRQRLHTVRATLADVEVLARELYRVFPYVFDYLFDTTDPAVATRGVRTLLSAARGLGTFGCLHFYFICNKDGRRVGFFKVDTASSVWLYRAFDWVSICGFVLFRLRAPNLAAFIRRARQAGASHGTPEVGELRLTYVVIFPEHQNQRYGSSFLRMLEVAHLVNNTNYVVSRRVVLHVRETNGIARHTFEKAGYRDVTPVLHQPLADPFAGRESPGPLLKMERTLKAA